MPSIARHTCVLTVRTFLIHSLHYARKALRRDAKGLISHGEMPRDIRGRSYVSIPGSKTTRRDAARLLSQGVRPRENRAGEVVTGSGVNHACDAVRPLDFCGLFFGLQLGAPYDTPTAREVRLPDPRT